MYEIVRSGGEEAVNDLVEALLKGTRGQRELGNTLKDTLGEVLEILFSSDVQQVWP